MTRDATPYLRLRRPSSERFVAALAVSLALGSIAADPYAPPPPPPVLVRPLTPLANVPPGSSSSNRPPPLFISPVARPPARPWPYGSFGPPGRVVWRREITDLGVTQVRFANNVRLNVKPTAFVKDEILVTVRFGQGLAGEPPGRAAPTWLLAGFAAGGTREMTASELRASLGDAVVGARATAADGAFMLSGQTRPRDLPRQLQLMTALIDRPAFGQNGVAALQGALASEVAAASTTPGGMIARDLPELLHGDARWRRAPTAEALAAPKSADLAALLGPALKSGAMEVTIVGDVTVPAAIGAVATTLAALPDRPDPQPAPAAQRTVHPPEGGGPPVVRLHNGRPEQAIAYLEWPTPDFHDDPHGGRVLSVAAAVMQSRFAERVRASEINPFPAGFTALQAHDLIGFGYLEAGVQAAPWKSEDAFRAVFATARDLIDNPPKAAEVREVLAPMLEAYNGRRATNAFWLTGLAAIQADPTTLEGLRNAASDEAAVTGAEVAAAARAWLTPERAWRLIVRAATAPVPTAAAVAPETTRRREGVWPQAYSDLSADPDIRFGVLANGMRYAIKRNTTPDGQASLRFRIAAGSLEEREDQRGLAHFLEHMAFKGSAHVPRDEMLRILERMGLGFGPDVNAFTQKDQTFFKLDLPRSDDERLDTGLMLLREIAGDLRLDQAAMDAERGVVLSEERLDESPNREAEKLEQAFYFDGQLAGRRDPMGDLEVLRRAPVSKVRAFYDAWYRPENATLIAVGDFDPAAMEARIKARFGDWRGKGPPGARPDLGVPKARGESAYLIARDGLTLAEGVVWARPFDDEADIYARERRNLIEGLGLDVLNRRLTRLAEGAAPPFLSAGASRVESTKSAQLTELWAQPAADGLERSLSAVVEEERRIAQYGVDEDEFKEVLKARRDNLGSNAASAPTALSAAIADRLLTAVGDDRVAMSPAQALAQFETEARGVTRADVDAALKTTFAGQGPLLVTTSPQPIAGGEAAVRAIYDAAVAKAVTAPEARVVKPWPYLSFGPAAKPVSRRETPDLGLTQLRFANGVRLNVKPVSFARNQIQVTVRIGDGLIGLPPDTAAPAWLLPAWAPGGTKELTADELQAALKGIGVTINAAWADDSLTLSGVTGPRDLARQMELFAALISRPGYRPEAVERQKALVGVEARTVDFTPASVLGVNLPVLLHRGDRRWAVMPTPEALAAAKPADLPALLDPILKTGAIEVTIVGDVTVDQAVSEVGRTLAALPQRAEPRAVPAASPTLRPPDGGGPPIVLRHKGRPDQAFAYVEWPTNDFYADPHEAHVLVLAASVLQNRLIDRIRVTEGATYSPNADSNAQSEMIGYGYVQALVEIPPPRIDGFYRDVNAILADLGRTPPSADEVLRARAPLLETEAKARESMDFWSYYLSHAQTDPREIGAIRRKITDFNSITAEEISAACRKYLTPERAWRLIVKSGD